mmetsp:Transcript_29731/g.33144  ORF Transcript_29731/g.33144 Transcript_29731/m.33144 type:complete len:435 (+) Transcript_29731:268-1572(+)
MGGKNIEPQPMSQKSNDTASRSPSSALSPTSKSTNTKRLALTSELMEQLPDQAGAPLPTDSIFATNSLLNARSDKYLPQKDPPLSNDTLNDMSEQPFKTFPLKRERSHTIDSSRSHARPTSPDQSRGRKIKVIEIFRKRKEEDTSGGSSTSEPLRDKPLIKTMKKLSHRILKPKKIGEMTPVDNHSMKISISRESVFSDSSHDSSPMTTGESRKKKERKLSRETREQLLDLKYDLKENSVIDKEAHEHTKALAADTERIVKSLVNAVGSMSGRLESSVTTGRRVDIQLGQKLHIVQDNNSLATDYCQKITHLEHSLSSIEKRSNTGPIGLFLWSLLTILIFTLGTFIWSVSWSVKWVKRMARKVFYRSGSIRGGNRRLHRRFSMDPSKKSISQTNLQKMKSPSLPDSIRLLEASIEENRRAAKRALQEMRRGIM